MKNNFQIMKLNLEANILRIQQLLEMDNIEQQFIKDRWCSVNKPNVELRQRLKMLRKDSIELERLVEK